MPSVRPTGCASQLPGPGREVDDRTPSAPSARGVGLWRDAAGSRCGEMWRDVARYGEMWQGVASSRCGAVWRGVAGAGRRPCFCSPGGPHAVVSRASSRARASAGSTSSGALQVAKCGAVWRIVAGLLARGAGVSTRLSSLPISTTTSRVACTGGVGYPVCPAGGARTMLLFHS